MSWYSSLEAIAAFFDGEGCVMINLTRNGNVKVEICITQKNPAVLERIRETLGYGLIRLRCNGAYDLRIRRREDVGRFIATVGAYTYLKKEALQIAEQSYTSKDASELKRQLSALNSRD